MSEPISIPLERAIRRLEFGSHVYQAPDWFEKPCLVLRPPRRRKLAGVPVSVSNVIEAVSTAFSIPMLAILGERKFAPMCRARFAVYHLLSKRLGYSTQKIANATRRKCHTTTMEGLRRAEQLMATDPAWAAAYRAAEHALDSK